MRASTALLAACASSLVAAKRVVTIGIAKGQDRLPPLHKRATLQELNNNLTGGGYYAEVSVGTPPQPVSLILDTGSSDVWVLDSRADLCRSAVLQYQYGGGCIATYDPDASSSFESLGNEPFEIGYLDGSGASGTYITENIAIGDVTIEGLQIGLAENSTINSGLLGIGYSSNVATLDQYPNIIDLFEEQGLISSRAYSLYLNDYESETGTILFGGVDTEKYIGSLQAVPTVPDAETGEYHSFTVALSSLVLNHTNGTSAEVLRNPTPVVLDSGTTLTYLPSGVVDSIYAAFGAVDDTSYTGLVFVDCEHLTRFANFTFDYQFGGTDGPIVRVPIDQIVLDNVQEYIALGLEPPPGLDFDDNICSFGIHPGEQIFLLGDTFLRSAYVVYDLINHEIALAQANLNATDSNVLEITRESGVPDVSGVANQVTVEQTATGLPGPGNGGGSGGGGGGGGSDALPTVTVTATPPPQPSASGNTGARTTPASDLFVLAVITSLAGLVGVGLVVL